MMEAPSLVELALRQGKLNDNGCITCPICGEQIPVINGGPEHLRHILLANGGRLTVLCPKHVASMMGWR